jgi:acetyltransferase-like isoleucine patch superfamily enzyme
MFSVVIAAHDEETTIGRCLEGILAEARPGEFEIITVCNGCRDRTADVARSFGPDVTVIETEVASKYLALRAGDERASAFPRFYIDADIVTHTQALRDVAAVLARGEVLVAAPRVRIDLTRRPWYVRSYYRLWTSLPYFEKGMVGTGFYALSEAGRGRFAEFPDLIADDQFVLSSFDETERGSVDSAEFVVAAPRTFRGLINMRTRVYTGNRQLHQRFGVGAQPGGRSAWIGVVCRQHALLSSVPVFLLVGAIADARSRRQTRREDFTTWGRDASIRVAEEPARSHDHEGGRGAAAFVRNVVDPRSWMHLLRMLHYYSYTHVQQRAKLELGPGAGIAPNVSFRNGERITIGAGSNIGERCSLWAGDHSGRISIGAGVMLAPQVFITASNYQFAGATPITELPRADKDVTIGDDVWLGAGVVVVAGVTVGNGCVVGAGSVVTHSLAPYSIAAGCPARVLGSRLADSEAAPLASPHDEGPPAHHDERQALADRMVPIG